MTKRKDLRDRAPKFSVTDYQRPWPKPRPKLPIGAMLAIVVFISMILVIVTKH